MAIIVSILITGCRKHEKDVEALSREAVEDEVTAVLDSLEQASQMGSRDTMPVTQITPPAANPPVIETAAPSASEPAGGSETLTISPIPPVETPVPSFETPMAETPEAPHQGKAGWVVQIGTFGDYMAAVEMADKYKQLTFPAFVRRVDKDGQTFYRLRVGVYDTYEQAKAVEEQLRSRYSLDTWIARNQ
ncbi:MAG: SPOR domain-containing protein [candidate division Zixibacteria bacterium]|nr:SPOR domain-containing protein [candidate division Zixibacteria bacterium]